MSVHWGISVDFEVCFFFFSFYKSSVPSGFVIRIKTVVLTITRLSCACERTERRNRVYTRNGYNSKRCLKKGEMRVRFPVS